MNKRKLGNSGLEVAPWALGGNVFGWTADEATSFRLLDAFVDAGLNLIDTADVYSKWIPGHAGGESETVIGHWLKKSGKRGKVLIATKLGVEMGPGETGLSRAYMMRAVERSLTRLQTDSIDLYQSHRDDDKTPMEETLAAFGELIKAGKVRAIGASNFKADRLAEALRVSKEKGLPRYESLQPWYNLYDRAEFEGPLAELCKRENIGVIPYFALASGFLSGKYRTAKDLEGKPRGYRVKDMMNERGFRILRALDTVAAEAKATPAQVSLAWLMGRVTAPIASATSLSQFNELLGATKLTLTAAQVKLLDDASAIDAAAAAAQTRTPPPSSR
ncbi:MAG: aldo/keto reductase [Acidobacteriota bacterium]|nr:aldo/keto reductase [Acidobacteriota bacterium]MDE3170788.1 aldo/keto reductase [Acidobacteriota bacterium]